MHALEQMKKKSNLIIYQSYHHENILIEIAANILNEKVKRVTPSYPDRFSLIVSYFSLSLRETKILKHI